MHEQHREHARPDDHARRGQRRRRGGRQHRQERGDEVREREEHRAGAVAQHVAEAGGQRRVGAQLEQDADAANCGEHEADAVGGQGEAAGEAQGRDRGRGGAGGAEEDVPQVLEAADVHGQEAAREQRGNDVAREDAAEGEGAAGLDRGLLRGGARGLAYDGGGEGRVLQLEVRAEGVVRGLVGGDGGVLDRNGVGEEAVLEVLAGFDAPVEAVAEEVVRLEGGLAVRRADGWEGLTSSRPKMMIMAEVMRKQALTRLGRR